MSEIQTGGGSAINGNVETGGGGFAGRDSQRNSVTVNNNDNDSAEQLWRAVTNLETRITFLEHDTRANARQYWIAIALFVVVIISIWWLSMKIDGYTKAAQNLSRIATEQRNR